MKFIDLFAGIGGFHIGLKELGHECVFASEINQRAVETYELNHGLKPYGDITQIAAGDVPEHDILCAGFPCQPFSIAGRQNGFKDRRGNLFLEIIRIAEYHKPKLMILENVRNLLKIENGEAFKLILNELDQRGYNVLWNLFNAYDFGVPQRRRRIFIVCVLKGSGITYHPPLPLFPKVNLKDIMLPDSETDDLVFEFNNGMKWTHLRDCPKVPVEHVFCLKTYKSGGQGQRVYSIQGPSITITASSGGSGSKTGLYLVNNRVRRLHVQEVKQCMGFPIDFKIDYSWRASVELLGNAIVPRIATEIVKGVKWS